MNKQRVLTPEEQVYEKYAFRITDQVKKTIHGGPDNDPVARQYIPQAEELYTTPEEHPDPIGDDTYSPVKGIVHRYPDRALFKIAHVCAVYCRYCFRREMVGPGGDILSPEEIDAALDYIRAHPEIFEIILTGGDPLVLSAKRLGALLDALEDIPHVKIIRIHSRVPIADPARITDDLAATLKRRTPVYIALHVNHVQEITPEVEEALARLRAVDCVLLSQSVLLRGVNDSADILETLYKKLLTLRIKPYYLHHPDFAPGTSHFRLTIKEGQSIMRALQGRISGLAQPHYMLDIPGGAGKVPLTPCYLAELEDGRYMVEDYRGGKHRYPPMGTKK